MFEGESTRPSNQTFNSGSDHRCRTSNTELSSDSPKTRQKNLLANLAANTSVTCALTLQIVVVCNFSNLYHGIQFRFRNELREALLLKAAFPSSEVNDVFVTSKTSRRKDVRPDLAVAISGNGVRKWAFVVWQATFTTESFIYLEWKKPSPRPPCAPTFSVVVNTKHTQVISSEIR